MEEAAVDYDAIYTDGLNFNGSGWNRENDNIGIGYAYLAGGNLDIDSTQAFEAYYRFGLNDYLGITADVQYMKDAYIDSVVDDSPRGWIFSLRLVAEF